MNDKAELLDIYKQVDIEISGLGLHDGIDANVKAETKAKLLQLKFDILKEIKDK